MSLSARDAIFEAIGSSDADSDRTDRIDREAQALLANTDAIRPARTTTDVVQAFINRVNGEKVAATAMLTDSLDDLPGIVKALLTDDKQPPAVTVQPATELMSLDWAGSGLSLADEPDDGVAVTLALWGVAETGSFAIHSGPQSPVLLHFLPAVSIVAVPAGKILWHLEDYAAQARQAGLSTPRNASLITGASGTTDIEGRLVTGAHGPGKLYVVVVGSNRQ
ncbi:MAG: lactate utilization protein C [Burkholderiaceae bacterium]